MSRFVADLEQRDRKIISNRFYDSGLHRRNNGGQRTQNWPRQTYCVFEINIYEPEFVRIYEPEVVKNLPGEEHAEIVMMNSLEEFRNQEMEVKVYMNYSPCFQCAKALIRFVGNPQWKIKLVIYFVELYRVKRKSCLRDGRCRNHWKFWRKTNVKGLQLLHSSQNFSLNNFTNTEWKDLAKLLEIENTSDDSRGREDEEIFRDFKHILSLR